MISSEDRATLETWQAIGELWQWRGERLIEAVNACFETKSTKGLEEMVAFSFNTQGITPKFGGGGGLPVGKHPVVIYNSKTEATLAGTGGKLVLQLEVIDGPMKGAKGDENLTLQHSNPTVVRISSEQLTAICHVVGKPNGIQQDTAEIHGIPFVVEVAPQKDKPEYTEIVGVFDMQGNEPGQQTGQPNNNNNNNNFGGNNGGGNNQNFNGNNAGNNGGGNGNNGGGNGGGGTGGWGAGGNGGGGQPQGDQNGQNGGNGGNNGSGGGSGWQQGGGGAANQGGGGWGAR